MPMRPLSMPGPFWVAILCLIGALLASAPPARAQTVSLTESARQLMDFAERSFPEHFPGHEATRASPPFLYRHYPLTGTYLGVVVSASGGYVVGDVHVMGGAFGGQPLRVGRIEDFIVPLAARALPRLAVGSGFMLAVQADGTLLSWGRGDSGGAVRALATQPLAGTAAAALPALGAVGTVATNGGNTQNRIDATSAAIGADGRVVFFADTGLSGTHAMAEWNGARALAVCPGGQALALLGDGTVAFSWRGNGTPYARRSVVLPLGGVVALSPHTNTDCNPVALTVDGTALRLAPRLTNPVTGQVAFESRRYDGLPPLVQVACGLSSADDETCLGLTADGVVWSWGENTFGTRGTGTATLGTPLPPAIVQGLPRVAGVAAGFAVSLALAEDGRVFSWGGGLIGRQPTGVSTAERNLSSYTPTPIDGIGAVAEVAVNGGGWQAVLRARDGSVWTWGFNTFGELGVASGQPNPGNQSQVPVRVTGVLLN